jgi:REP element-mobilizing transposase RayT
MKSQINDLTTPKGLNQNKQTLMSTYGHALYQIVFSTKYRERTLVKSDRDKLFRYMWGVLEHKKCHLYRLGGVEDHIHIIVNIHPTNSVSNLIKDIKLASSAYIKQEGLFPDFAGWQNGYAYFTYSMEAKDNLIEYVKNQEAHHHKHTFIEELKAGLTA